MALQFNFWVAHYTYNSLYLYVVSVIEQVTWIIELQFTIYILQLIVIKLQLSQNNSFSTTMQLHYNCTHHVMLTLLIVIHLLKSNRCHYEKHLTQKLFYFRNIDFHRPLWLLMMVWDCEMWHNFKNSTWHNNYIYFLNKNILVAR